VKDSSRSGAAVAWRGVQLRKHSPWLCDRIPLNSRFNVHFTPRSKRMCDMSSESSAVAHSEGDSSVASDEDVLEKLCVRIHRRTSAPVKDPLPVAEHTGAVSMMLKARDVLIRGGTMSQNSRTCIVCSGVAVMRRICAEVESEENTRLLRTTMTLLFTLLVMAEGDDYGSESEYCQEAGDVEEEGGEMQTEGEERQFVNMSREYEQLLASWLTSSLSDIVLSNETHASSATSWDQLVRSDSTVGRAALRQGRHVKKEGAMQSLERLSNVFFRCSASAMMASMVTTASATGGGGDLFLTLDALGAMNEMNNLHGEKLSSIVDAAESEAGQSVLRDFILSFKLPQEVVGVRRVLMLSREANAQATKNYTEVLNSAHEAAMRGANWSWEKDPDPVHKMAALLAGFAVILAKTPHAIRKGDAFGGRVALPFIECSPPCSGTSRLGLIPSTGEWVVFTVSDTGGVKVQCSANGFDGMCSSALAFSKSVRV
jgi:hypothetical protein